MNGSEKSYYIIVALMGLLLLSSAQAQSDDSGKPVRIIGPAPNVTEILFALGVGDKIVGVSDFCDYPSQTKGIAKIGGTLNPNIEQIISLQPDLLILLPGEKSLEKKLKIAIDIRCLYVKNETIGDVLDAIGIIGKEVGAQQRAADLVKGMRGEIQAIRQKYEGLPKKRVLCVVDKTPGTLRQLYVAANNTFLDEIISLAGGENVVKNSIARYPIISKESVIAFNPEVVLDFSLGNEVSQEKKKKNMSLWSSLSTLSAVKTGSVFTIDNPRITIQGPELPRSIEILARYIHGTTGK